MRSFGVLCAIVVLAWLQSACGLTQRAFPSTLSDAQMLSVMNRVHRNAVEAGSLAQAKSALPAVQAFARTMVAEHGAMLEASHQLMPRTGVHPADAALSEWIHDRHDEAMVQLRNAAGGPDFDRIYLDHQMEMLEQAISDTGKFVFGVEHPLLKEQFLSVKPTLQSQFETAEHLRRTLVGPPG